MARFVALVLLVGLASCTTTRGAGKGIAVGAGIVVAGLVVVALENKPNGGSFNLTEQQEYGLLMAGGGFVIGGASLIALIAIAIYNAVPPSRTPVRPTPATPNEHCGIDGSCVPLGPAPTTPPTEHCGVDGSCVPLGPRPPTQQRE
jgi:hypothetical protein